jgi:hypothetical protein
MGLARPGDLGWFMGSSPGLDRQQSVCWVLGLVWNQTDLCLQCKPESLRGYPYTLLTLFTMSVV